MFKAVIRSIFVGSMLVVSSLSFAADIDMNADENDLAIKGYDPVSYFSMSSPKLGTSKYTATYKGAIYRFSSEENRNTFKQNPDKFVPQYGGYCAFGVAMEKKFDTDPLAWRVVDGKLYLNLNKDVQKKWLTDVPGYLSQSNENWTAIKGIAVDKL